MGDLDNQKSNHEPALGKTYYAHSGDRSDFSDWQSLPAHLKGVADLAEKFASWFGGQDLARNAGLLHDLGKYCDEFMARLQGSSKRVDHATAGAKIAFERWGMLGQLLSYCIAGHHAGLANGVDEGQGRSTLRERLNLKLGSNGLPVLDEVWQKEIQLTESLTFPTFKPPLAGRKGFQVAFLIRMIFSCLIDADRTDTSRYYQSLNCAPVNKNEYPTLLQLKSKLFKKLDEFAQMIKQEDTTSINHLRQYILQHSIEQAKLEPGLFSLTVPTGGGKTYTSMAFALEHAVKLHLNLTH